MAKERYISVPEESLPKDGKITQFEMLFCNQDLAEAYDFPDIIPEGMEDDVCFYVALGMNEAGEVIGAKLLRKRPINFDLEHWLREREEKVMDEKAKKVFGIKEA
jgi:hypothetical protein